MRNLKTKWMISGALAAVGAIAGCSSSSSNGAGTGPYGSCLSSLLGSSCTSCLQANCGGALGDFQTGCGDYLGCICPGGNFSAPNAQSETCTSKLGESSCLSSQGDAGVTACAACQSSCASSNGSPSGDNFGDAGTSSPGSGSSSGGAPSDCGIGVLPATSAVSLTLTGVDFGDATMSEWEGIGFNLDGLCTTASSANVCSLASGASPQVQDDGSNGIDNSYGENLCAVFDTLAGNGACSTKLTEVYLQSDANGDGTLVVGSMVYPAHDIHVALSGSGGMAGGVLPTAGVAAAWQNAAPCISTSLCSGSALQSILTSLDQAADIGADGTDTAGSACDGISFGMKFTGSTPVTSLPSAPNCSCQ